MTADVSPAVRLSVPGKVILMGEHAAVYGRPAVVAAVERRLGVEAAVGAAGGGSARGRVLLDLPDIGVREEHRWPAVEAFANEARRRWREFEAGERPFRADRDRSALVRIAVGEALASLAPRESAWLRERSLELRLRSKIAVGAGLGSSAAAAVGVIAAVRAVPGGFGPVDAAAREMTGDFGSAEADADADEDASTRRPDAVVAGRRARTRAGARGAASAVIDGKELQAIEAAALEVERRQHGFPSGIDSGTVLRGGVLLVRREEGELRFDDLPRRDWLRREILIVDSGTPGQTTGDVVTTVRRRVERAPDRMAQALDRIGGAAEAFREALLADRTPAAATAIAAGHRGLAELGVVPPAVAARIGRVEASGGAAKISGAGALEGESAGALVCMLRGQDPATVDGLSDLLRVDAPIGADGLRFED